MQYPIKQLMLYTHIVVSEDIMQLPPSSEPPKAYARSLFVVFVVIR